MDMARIESSRVSHKAAGRVHDDNDGPSTKRQKVRKGTRSCWECRRRKMKCVFSAPTDAVCADCHRRGAKCVAQELPEEISDPLSRSLQLGDRVVRVERLVGQLLKKAEETEPETHIPGLPTPASVEFAASHSVGLGDPFKEDQDLANENTPNSVTTPFVSGVESSKYARISQTLFESMPSPRDSGIISKARGNVSYRFIQMLTVPYHDLYRSNDNASKLMLARPKLGAHPVLMARYMLQVASFLQHLHPDYHKEIQGLSENPCQLQKQLVHSATSAVTVNDELVGNVEGLECIMLESMYQTNSGNLRKGLIVIRRAIVIAQLMGLHRSGRAIHCETLDPNTKSFPQFIWFRIVYLESQLCLMLGIPQSTTDHSTVSKSVCETDHALDRLERIHCVITSRILNRNQSDPGPQDFISTQEMDGELQSAMRCLPSNWWLPVNLASVKGDSDELFWDMRRLFHQLFHNHLLNQLHLPYLLRSSCSKRHNTEYSRITCVNAAREVLSRFVTFRKFTQIAYGCRTIDFISLMAAMTLLLAHIDEHRGFTASSACWQKDGHMMTESVKFLAHQRPSDIAMIEQVLVSMEEFGSANDDALSKQSAELLRGLLSIESQADSLEPQHQSNGSIYAQTSQATWAAHNEANSTVHISIPYFGIVNVSRNGIIWRNGDSKIHGSRVVPEQPPMVAAQNTETAPLGATRAPAGDISSGYGSITWKSETNGNLETRQLDLSSGSDENSAAMKLLEHSSGPSATLRGGHFSRTDALPQLSTASTELLLQNEYPTMTAGADEWAFQGVDMAFFDILLRDSADFGSESA